MKEQTQEEQAPCLCASPHPDVRDVYIVDSQGITIFVGPASRDYYGAEADELVGRHVHDLQKAGYFEPAITPLVLRQRRPVIGEQITRTRRRLHVRAFPVFDPGRNLRFVVCLSSDASTNLGRDQDAGEASTLPEAVGMVTGSQAMRSVLELVWTAAQVDVPVLLIGETGVGKNLVARAIHRASKRASGPFVNVNCAAIPESLFEAELFGYVPGAFTGADRKGRTGLFAAAEGGTLFLDEIAELPLATQAKLLQAVEERRYRPLGTHKEKAVDARIIAATNQDLQQKIAHGKFRSDLYFRLSVLTITIPPLRDRPDDIVPLAQYFLQQHNSTHGTNKRFSAQALKRLLEYPWPGNVRELRHFVERLALLVPREVIDECDVLTQFVQHPCSFSLPATSLREAKRRVEEQLIRQAYSTLRSSYKVAQALGISQSAAYKKIKAICGGTFPARETLTR